MFCVCVCVSVCIPFDGTGEIVCILSIILFDSLSVCLILVIVLERGVKRFSDFRRDYRDDRYVPLWAVFTWVVLFVSVRAVCVTFVSVAVMCGLRGGCNWTPRWVHF